MRAQVVRGWVRLTAGVLLALAVSAALSPNQARAGCSSHSSHATGIDSLTRYIDPVVLTGSESPTSDTQPPAFPGLPRPCSGPSCSGYPGPPSVPSLTIVRLVEPWAYLGLCVSVTEGAAGFHSADLSTLRPTLLTSAIFHPPRSGMSPLAV